MAWLRHISAPKGSTYHAPGLDPWPVGEAREVDDERAAYLLTEMAGRFVTAARPSLTTPAAPSLTRAAPVVEADDGAAPAEEPKAPVKRKRAPRKRKTAE